MAKSKFDFSLLKPVNENNADFESKLKPVSNEDEEDQGEYLDNLPEEPGFFHKLPRNIAIGLAHAGRNLHNLLHDIAKQFEHGTEFFNKAHEQMPHSKQMATTKPLSEYLPNDERDFSDVFGGNKDSKSLGDKLIQGGIEHAPELIGGAGLLRGGLRRLTGTHQLDAVERAAHQSGLDFSYHPHTIEEARNYFPTSHATEEMVAGSNAGHYTPSFSAQSQVGHHQRNLENSALAADRLLAPRAAELKQTMLGELGHALRTNGMHAEADMLMQGINNYRQYMQVTDAAKRALKALGLPATLAAAVGFGYRKAKSALSD